MAFSWYVENNDGDSKLFSGEKLKELVASGRLLRTDLVRREDQTKPVLAGKIKGLFAEGETTTRKTTSTPPLPAKEPVLASSARSSSPDNPSEISHAASRLSRVGSHIKGLGETSQAAAGLAVAQGRKAHLTKMAIPAAFLELGRANFAAGRFRDEFADLYSRITATQQERERLRRAQIERQTPTTVSEKASDAASRVKVTAQAKLLALKEESFLRQLGESSYERHGERSGPENLVRPISECRSKLEALDREIEQLSGVGKGRFITPRKLLIGAIACCVVVIGLMAFKSGNQGDRNWENLVAGISNRNHEPERDPGDKDTHKEGLPRDHTSASYPSDEPRKSVRPGAENSPDGKAEPVITVTLPDFSKVNYRYDFSKDDYESIPKGARRETRSRPFQKTDLDETEVTDELLVGKWLEDSGFTDSQGKFVRQGKRVIWYDTDKRQRFREDRWLNGKCHGIRTTWHRNGSTWGESTFVLGKRHGESRQWYEDGNPILNASYLNGKKHGPYVEYHSNRRKKSEKVYVQVCKREE